MESSQKMIAAASSSSASASSRSSKFLPPEILSMILEKLPVKMLLRFRCVCKPWRSIIDDPNFVYTHLQLCNNNNSNYNSGKLLLLEGTGSGGEYGCKLTLRRASNLRKIGNFFECGDRYHFYGVCNSLVLMGRDHKLMQNGLRICNPSLRRSLRLPPCPLEHLFGQLTMFIFGFLPRTNDFKVIVFQLLQAGQVREMRAAAYTLSQGNWIVRDDTGFDSDFTSSFRELRGFYVRSNPSYLEGAMHWLGKPPSDKLDILVFRPTHLISLDLETESFSFLELPGLLDDSSQKWRFVFVLGHSLAVFNSSTTTSNIWLLRLVNGVRTWTPWFSGPSSEAACTLFADLDQRTSVIYFDGNGDGDVGSLVYEKSCYNIASGQVRSMAKSMSHFVDFKLYSESLVMAGVDNTDTDDTDSPFSWN